MILIIKTLIYKQSECKFLFITSHFIPEPLSINFNSFKFLLNTTGSSGKIVNHHPLI